jgi:hypothetical protein
MGNDYMAERSGCPFMDLRRERGCASEVSADCAEHGLLNGHEATEEQMRTLKHVLRASGSTLRRRQIADPVMDQARHSALRMGTGA